MFKTKAIISALAIALMVSPMAALAHDNNRDNENNDFGQLTASKHANDHANFEDRFGTTNLDKILDEKNNVKTKMGTVTAIASNSFTLMAKDGTSYTVNTAGAKISLPFNGTFTFGQIQVNDAAKVRGTVNGNVVTAKSVVIVPVNTQKAKASGTITAVSGNTVTLQTKGDNTVTVNTSGSTVTKADGTVGTTGDVQVGTAVKIQGLWNSVTSVFNAIKIGIMAMI